MGNHGGAKDGCNPHIGLIEVGLVTQSKIVWGLIPLLPSNFLDAPFAKW
jgi:hypothetical protein